MDGGDEETMNPRVISVRRMDADDEEAVKALAGRAFSPLASLSFPRSPDALIAERRGELVGAALQSFEERGCREMFACVEGYNSSSANLFAARGFTILSFGEQLRRYGFLGTLLLWLKTSRLGADVGHFLWTRPGQPKPDDPALQWWAGMFASALVLLLAGWRGGWLGKFDPMIILGAVVIVVALYGLRGGAE